MEIKTFIFQMTIFGNVKSKPNEIFCSIFQDFSDLFEITFK